MTATESIAVDTHWGLVPEGEAARLIGAGDPNEIAAGAQPTDPEDQ